MVRVEDSQFQSDSGGTSHMGIVADAPHQAASAAPVAVSVLRGLLEASPDALVVTDAEGRITILNRLAETLFGYRSDELLGCFIEQLVPETFHNAHAAHRADYMTAPRTRPMGEGRELRGRRKDGEEFPAEISLSPLRVNGDLLVLASVRDVTNRVRAAERQRFLAEASRTLAATLDLAETVRLAVDLAVPWFADFAAIDVVDEHGTLLEAAASHVEPDRLLPLCGMRHRSPVDLVAAHGRARVLRTGATEVVLDPALQRLQTEMLDHAGLAAVRELQLRSSIIVPLLARGRKLGVLVFATAGSGRSFGPEDVTFAEDLAGRYAEEIDNTRLYRSERDARITAEVLAAEREAVLAHIADGVIVADAAGRVRLGNRAARELLGLAAEDHPNWADATFPPLIDPNQTATTLEGMLAAARHGVLTGRATWRIPRADHSEVHVKAAVVPIVTAEGERRGAVLTLHDVTAAQELERERNEFLTNVSHDLRTPLAAMRTSIGVVLANEPSGMPDHLHRMLVNADLAGERMGKLITDLLELARVQAGSVPLRRQDLDARGLSNAPRGRSSPSSTREGSASS